MRVGKTTRTLKRQKPQSRKSREVVKAISRKVVVKNQSLRIKKDLLVLFVVK
jgi:hypothetical protein